MLRSIILAAAAALVATAGQSQTIKIAILGPMAFVQGENHWAGAEMARDEINKAGGINVGGKRLRVELIRADTNEIQSVPDATNAMERVITRDKADFLIGGFRSEAVLAMQEVAMDYKKIFLGAGAAHSKLGANVEANYQRYKYWFRVTPVKDTDLVRTLFAVLNTIGQQIRTELKTDMPKVAILAEKAVWTEALIAAAQKNLPAMKMEVVGTWQPSATATDVTAELSAIDRAGAQLVFTIISGPVGISVGRQMGERNMKRWLGASTSRRRRRSSGRRRPARHSSCPRSTRWRRWKSRRRQFHSSRRSRRVSRRRLPTTPAPTTRSCCSRRRSSRRAPPTPTSSSR
jgi:branched-chain amino acid transport system substrate-binding protein